ncbi:golgin subfamily A member 5-like [Saccoglossus kowalevskii]|uniref:Golgin subfamily A member 5-like isoform X2 n=1 Tax=Saccoglossus kowalevskii TaxID=10224 RepID=A0ABM0LX86_SACKO|nr:PREDICTED: golgin subfamily A member 5-like isoform X2 [Saccoglossus kowalevskii]
MSWLLGKAEDLLNKMDQSASDVLTKTANHDSMYASIPEHTTAPQNLVMPDKMNASQDLQATLLNKSVSAGNLATYLASTSNISRTNTGDSALNKPPQSKPAVSSNPSTPPQTKKSSKAFQSKPKKKDEDEKLFEFLNSPDTLSTERKKDKQLNGRHSRRSSTSSTTSTRTDNASAEGSVGITISIEPSADDHNEHTDGSDSAVGNEIADSTHNATPESQQEGLLSSHSQQLSSLELENKLLKNEVSSLNQEMASVVQRARSAQEEMNRLRNQLRNRSSQMTETDSIIRQHRSREEDYVEAIAAKDSQLAVLRVRLEDLDKEVREKIKTIDILQNEKDRILKDHTDSSGLQGQALDSVREKLQESEAALKREIQTFKQSQVDAMQRQSRVEEEHRTLSSAYSLLQQQHNHSKTHTNNLSMQLKTAKNNLDHVKQELNDYKQKATRILQSKDKLINSLKESDPSIDQGTVTGIELEELKQDRDAMKEELQVSKVKLEQLRSELQDLEFQSQTDSDMAQEQIQDLEQQLSDHRRQVKELEAELTEKRDEMKYMQQELLKQKTNFQVRLQDREDEIHKLRNQLTTKTMSTTSQTELENRLHALTESLIQKQTMLEALSTEKNSLVVQLERMEKQFDEAKEISAIRAKTHHAVSIEETEDGIRQRNFPEFLNESPLDTGVTRGMKKAAYTLDRFSVKLGIFLRRYPIARLFVILYMILLHLWVMVVLLTYTPEMHGSDYVHSPQGMEPREPQP